MKYKIISIISRAGSLGIALALLWHLSNIARYGEHIIREPGKPILVAEIAMVSILAALCAISLFRELKSKGGDAQQK